MRVDIKQVETGKELKAFIQFRYDLYRGDTHAVPFLYADELGTLDRKQNPAFDYCDAAYFLAFKAGKVVGRIAAIINTRANTRWNQRMVRFGWFDFIDDLEVSSRLIAAVEHWGAERGMTEIGGPFGFDDMDREGMLVEGFDRRSCFFTYYNYPYYIDHMAALGYGKDVDWIEELIAVPTDEATIQRWEKISDFVLKRHHLHIHEAKSRLSYLPLLKPFFELVNLAYAPLYGTVELGERQIRKYSAKFAPLINPNTTCFVMDENDRMVAFGVGAPSLASALQKHRGRLMPTGWIDVLKSFRRNDTVDLLLIAVHPDYQKKGVNAIILSKTMKGCHKLGIKQAETGPMLELNDKVQSQWKDFQTEQHKRRRCFIKQL